MINVSIIIPYYQNRKGLSRLLKSIPEIPSIEVIVVNDHSDCVVDVIKTHSQAMVVSQDDNKRWAGAARNKGLNIARGKYIMFADTDDYFLDDAFNIVEKYLHKDFDVVYFTPTSINENGKPSLRHTKYSDLVTKYLKYKDESIRYEYFVPWSKLYKAELLSKNNIKFDEVIASNDVMFSLFSGFYGNNFHVTQQTIYCVVESSNSLTKVVSEQVADSRFNVLCRYNDFIKKELKSDKQVSVISCISRARKIGIFKMLSVLFYSLHKGYPIIPNSSGIKRWFQRIKS